MGEVGNRFSSRLRSSDEPVEYPVYCSLRHNGETYTLVIDRNKDNRCQVRWEEQDYLFPISFSTLELAEHFAEAWLNMAESGFLEDTYDTERRSSVPSGKDCMGLLALVLLLATLVLLLYLFG